MRNVLLLARKLSQLSPAEFVLLCRALFRVCIAACTVHLLPYMVLRHTLRAINAAGNHRPPVPRLKQVPVEQLARAINRVSRVVPGATCLTRAIAASKLMHHEGYPARIRFGVSQPTPERLGAHCWVEINAVAVLSAEGYEPLRPTRPV